MSLFSKRKGKKNQGWLSVGFQPDGISAVHAHRVVGGKPVIEWLAFYPAEKAALPAVLARMNKERGTVAYQCIGLLSSGDYQVLSLEAPSVPPDELKNAVRWRLKDMLDYHIDDATFDVMALPAEKSMGARNGAMFAVVAKTQLIGQIHGLFEAADVEVRVIDIPDMAQRNIAALVEPEGRAIALLSVTADGTLLTLTAGGELYSSRRIDVTAAQLSQPYPDAVLACHERITLELQRSLDHFDRQHHTIPLAKVILAPMGDGAAGLQAYLSSNLYVPIEPMDLDAVLDLSRVPELRNKEAQQRHFLAIGAALRHEETAL